jgi:hypothetical protein
VLYHLDLDPRTYRLSLSLEQSIREPFRGVYTAVKDRTSCTIRLKGYDERARHDLTSEVSV